MSLVKKVLLICAVVFACISLAIGSAVYFYGDEMKAYAFGSLKQKLNKDIQIGDTEFAGISHFPNIGLNIHNLYSPGFNANDTLLFAPNAAISFNLIDILSGNIEIEKIALERAKINLGRDENGKTNFDFSNSNNNTESSNSSFAFNNLKLLDVTFNYLDEKTNTNVDVWFDDMVLKGIVDGDIIDIESNGIATINSINADGTEWVNNTTTAKTNASIRYNQAEKSIHFAKSKVSLNDNPLIVNGTIITLDNYNQYQLSFSSEGLKLNECIPLIPNKFADLFENYNSSGMISLNCTLSGSDADDEGLVTEI
ncbi:MAG: AsmA family protein, partial [Bacteroidia bacterium]|nr:AsmA family protein [Bacteroidia bacterium]